MRFAEIRTSALGLVLRKRMQVRQIAAEAEHNFSVMMQDAYLSARATLDPLQRELSFVPPIARTRRGFAGDPINLVVKGTRHDLVAAMVKAGWLEAQPLGLRTSAKMALRTATRRSYPDAPFSSLCYGTKTHIQDLAFQRPGQTTKVRDHVRFWFTGRWDARGIPIWVGSATKDVGIGLKRRGFGPTHRISPHVDEERSLIERDLLGAGARPLGRLRRKPWQAVNGGGDPYQTDGNAVVLEVGRTYQR